MKSLRFTLFGFAGLLGGIAAAQAQDCTTDADCAVPLRCEADSLTCSRSGSPRPDGGTFFSPPVCESSPPSCAWSLVACTSTSECTQAHWACLGLPAVGASSVCFPEGIVCAAGQTCPAAWSCVDFSKVAEGSLVDMWSPTHVETRYCFPDALRGVADKTTKVDSTRINPGQPEGTESGGGPATRAASDDGRASTDTSDAGAPPAPSTVPSGCTLGGRNPAPLPWCLLAGLVLARLCRRRRA